MKKLLATLLASTMALSAIGGLVACGGDGGNGGGGSNAKELKPSEFSTVTNLDDPLANKGGESDAPVPAMEITIWAPGGEATATTNVHNMYATLLEGFTSDSYHNGKYKNVTFKFEHHDEGNAYADIGEDATGGPDVFLFSGGQAGTLMSNMVLQPLRGATGSYYSAAISQRDNPKFASVVTDKNGYMHAFPLTADNGYMLAYRKDIITDPTKVEKLDDILAIAYEQNLSFTMNVDDGFFGPSFFYGAGVVPKFAQNDSNFNDFKSDKAEIGAKALINYYKKGTVKDGSRTLFYDTNDAIIDQIVDETAIAGFCGTWQMEVPTGWEDRIGFAKLPKYTFDGTDYQLGCFFGGKYCGVNARKDKATIQVAMAVANYMSNGAAQLYRFEQKGSGPSNTAVANGAAVQASPQLVALNEQFAVQGAFLETDVPNSFWTGWETWVKEIAAGTVTADTLKLDSLVGAMTPIAE